MIKTTNRRDAALNVAAAVGFLLLAAFIHGPQEEAQTMQQCLQHHPERYCRLAASSIGQD